MTATPHLPVLLDEMLAALAPKPGCAYVDGTFGAGGYSRKILESADCIVWAIDRDPSARVLADLMAERFRGRLFFIEGRFGEMDRLLADRSVTQVQGIVLDLGVSSMQIDNAERGFSFRFDGPLDMRMGQTDRSAADLVNGLDEGEIADIVFQYGEERMSRRVARAIVERRASAPITRTAELADIVRRVVRPSRDGIDPATRTFQALRMAVNDELGEIDRGLSAAERLLSPGGRLVVVTFHSLEDRRVKLFLRQRSGVAPAGSRHRPVPDRIKAPSFRLIASKPVSPAHEEIARNPRARSARLRAAERTSAPAWPQEEAA
jgi:16S rRNA (cytosine1402-N4)-methyltransferase